jgi:hypothetical protein
MRHCSALWHTEAIGDPLGGVDGPLLLAVEDTLRKNTNTEEPVAEPVGFMATGLADRTPRILLRRQGIDVVNEV